MAIKEIRKCDKCGMPMKKGFYLAGKHARSEKCAIALYGGDRERFGKDLDLEDIEPGSTDCYWAQQASICMDE